ncbi:MAG: hypothetical protein AB7F76_01065 [Parvibaculaceae bacterium]
MKTRSEETTVRHFFIATAAILFALLGAFPASAQDQQQAPKVVKIEPYIIEKFVKYVVIAVDQANQTGNYEVLHSLGSPKFQETTTTEVLAKSFEPMRKSGLDLSTVLLYKPRLSSKPELVNGVLRATGYFPTQPLKVNFDILWILKDQHLLLHGLILNPAKEEAQAAPASTTKTDKPAAADQN